MPPLDSEAISRAEYDDTSRTLFLRFAGGDWYAYAAVPRAVLGALMAAESKDRFFQEMVRDRYAFVKLDPLSRP